MSVEGLLGSRGEKVVGIDGVDGMAGAVGLMRLALWYAVNARPDPARPHDASHRAF
ncbi:hypothetical protein K1W54_32650 [Micromonospora sp. CPCC 205371]|nr:hypothetical protein [Micromonospora sp. CPCC 205371]